MRDILLVAWKERIQLLSNREVSVGIFLLPTIYGILLPIAGGKTLTLQSPLLLVLSSFVAGTIASINSLYAFAGEHESQTLPTLLTTRLSDSSLVFGKTLFAVVSAYVSAISMVVLYLLVFNIFVKPSNMATVTYMDNPSMLIAVLVLPFFFALFSTSTGMLISIKTKSTKTGAGIAVLPELPIIGLFAYIIFANPMNLSMLWNILVIVLILIALSAGFFALTIGAFRRDKMILRL